MSVGGAHSFSRNDCVMDIERVVLGNNNNAEWMKRCTKVASLIATERLVIFPS